jgi:hypothetical protein
MNTLYKDFKGESSIPCGSAAGFFYLRLFQNQPGFETASIVLE